MFQGRKGREFEIDERMLLHIYGPEIIDTTAFHHFLIKKQTLVSIHEATKHKSISQGILHIQFIKIDIENIVYKYCMKLYELYYFALYRTSEIQIPNLCQI